MDNGITDDMESLEKTFKALSASTYNNISGVYVYDTGVSGKCVGITICTHGNEPCGLSVAEKFLNGEVEIVTGKVIIVLNNIEATRKYFASRTEQEKKHSRFVDVNMNRLPAELSGTGYEIKRALQLLPVWNEFDYALDIHSAAQKTPAMLIEGLGDASTIMNNMPVEIVIKNIVQTQLGLPAIGFYGDKCISIGLEAGSHEDATAQDKAVECTLAMLKKLNMVGGEAKPTDKQSVYTVHSSVILPNDQYLLSRELPMFSTVDVGEVLATDGTHEITSPIQGAAILAPKGLKPSNYNEEAFFICTVE